MKESKPASPLKLIVPILITVGVTATATFFMQQLIMERVNSNQKMVSELESSANRNAFTTSTGARMFTPEEIGEIAADYLIKHPQKLVEAGNALENAKATASLERLIPYAPALFDTTETPNIGPDNADVAVIEFFDYQCHFCMRVSPVVDTVLDQNKDVKLFFKEFPIFAGTNPVSAMGAATGLYIFHKYGADGYRKYHNNVMSSAYAFYTSKREFNLAEFDAVVKKSGFDVALTDKDKTRFENVISANMQLGDSLGVSGTPGFIIINMKKPTAETTSFIPGALDIGALQAAIQKARG